jgi:DNA-binding SARP family transcriptional activator/DNA-binding beta-propeller fold protein YncE
VEFRILGPFEVWSNGERLVLGRGRQKALLALLLLHANRVVPRGRLIDELWGETPPATAGAALLNYVSRLRRLLGEGRLETHGPGYQLRIAPEELDAARFERHVNDERFDEALALWRGPALVDFGSAPFAQPEAARLEELRITVLEERIERELGRGRHREVIGELEALAAAYPLRERFRVQLMLALFRAERQAEALDVYRQARRTLVDELGIEPGEELQRLERAILTHDPSLLVVAEPSERGAPDHEPTAPTGTVTFLFTDIEGSTLLVRHLGDDYAHLLAAHNRLLAETFAAYGGHEVDRQGDALFVSFRRARDALTAAVAVQRAIADTNWPGGVDVRIRIGIHTGEPAIAETGYHGLDVVRAARISAAAHGDQILVSGVTASLLADGPPAGITLEDLGGYRLKGLDRAERVFQVVAEGLPPAFPPLRTAREEKLAIAGREDELATAASEALLRREPSRRAFRGRARPVGAALAGVGLVAAAVAIGLFLLVRSDRSTSLTGLSAHSVGLIDPAENRLVAEVPIGRSVRHVAVSGDTVWVAKLAERIVLSIDPEKRRVVTSFGIGDAPTGIAVVGNAVWVVTIRATLLRIDDVTGRPTRRVPLDGNRVPTASDLEWPPRLTVLRDALWVSRGSTVWEVNASNGQIAARYKLDGVATGIAASEEGIWVAERPGALTRIDPDRHVVAGRTGLPDDPVGVAAGAGSVWVNVPGDNVVWRIDPLTGSVSRIIETGYRPWVIAAGAGGVWVASWNDQTVQRIDPSTDRVVATIAIANAPVDLAATDDAVWVAAAGQQPEWPEPVAVPVARG